MRCFTTRKRSLQKTVGFRFEADLFESVQIIIDFVVVDNIETFRHWKMGAAESVDFRLEAHHFLICTDAHMLLLSWTTLKPFTIRERLLKKPLVSDSKQIFANQY